MTEFRLNPDFRSNHTYLIPSMILGRFLNEQKNLNLTATLDVPVDRFSRTQNEQFKLKVTFNYFFPWIIMVRGSNLIGFWVEINKFSWRRVTRSSTKTPWR